MDPNNKSMKPLKTINRVVAPTPVSSNPEPTPAVETQTSTVIEPVQEAVVNPQVATPSALEQTVSNQSIASTNNIKSNVPKKEPIKIEIDKTTMMFLSFVLVTIIFFVVVLIVFVIPRTDDANRRGNFNDAKTTAVQDN